MRRALVVVGTQWGDEGKGKVIDHLTERADVVVRYAGGPNAGHTLVVDSERIVVRLVPSGVLRPSALNVMAQGMVLDLKVLVGELDALAARGVALDSRLLISSCAHVIMPFHIEVDGLRETAAAEARRIGTTKKGIGPAYEDKAARRGIRLGDLVRGEALGAVEAAIAAWEPVLEALGGEVPRAAAVLEDLAPLVERVAPFVGDAGAAVEAALRRGARVLCEGAQGTLLDLDHGTYPFVTSSSATAGGASTGIGIGPTRIGAVLGLVKAYTTRVGGGPFPTELFDADGEHLQTKGGEFGSVTGRPRRTGWLDLPALRYAARVNGLSSLAVTKLDVLTGLPHLRICVAYDTPAGRQTEFPLESLADAKPVLEDLEAWPAPLGAARELAALPPAARRYLDRIADELGVPVALASVGAERDATIELVDPFGPCNVAEGGA